MQRLLWQQREASRLWPVILRQATTQNASDNDHIFTTKSPKGNIGKSMSISFRVRATDEDMNNLKISLYKTSEFQQIESKDESEYTIDYYPFEIMETTFVGKKCGKHKRQAM